MKLVLFLSLVIFALSAQALTLEKAIAQSKNRIESLSHGFAKLAYNCHVYEEDCKITDNSQSVILKWISSEFSQFKPDIRYEKGADKFTIDGAIRIAKTGKSWGSPVIFNEDLLFREVSQGNYEPLGFFDIIGVLVHEYGHHQETELRKFGLRVPEHQELDEIAVKVVSYLKDRTRKIQISKDEVPELAEGGELDVLQIDIEWYNGVRNIWSHLYLDSPSGVEEISSHLLKGVQCPKMYQNGHLTFSGTPAFASFRQVETPEVQYQHGRLVLEQKIGDASVLCIDRQMGVFHVFDGYKEGLVKLAFRLNSSGLLEFERGESFFRATPPEDIHGH